LSESLLRLGFKKIKYDPDLWMVNKSSHYAVVNIARILKASTIPAGFKYKFGIQVPKGIKNAIDADKENGNQL
jgi:hypothetical protein